MTDTWQGCYALEGPRRPNQWPQERLPRRQPHQWHGTTGGRDDVFEPASPSAPVAPPASASVPGVVHAWPGAAPACRITDAAKSKAVSPDGARVPGIRLGAGRSIGTCRPPAELSAARPAASERRPCRYTRRPKPRGARPRVVHLKRQVRRAVLINAGSFGHILRLAASAACCGASLPRASHRRYGVLQRYMPRY